ncbi:hypothetical protein PNP85_04510 [Halobacterium salinarum]|nr:MULTISPECIES: hypothetical protein [Halobacterium]MDL0123444.1 hypothetical protein [Halobacterium salinarum]MDL0138767.1 hypothetical protein [Halobacterium salinarum]WOY07762.1 hypothetical protein QSJ49_13230 [Halobacterium salinarum]
MVFGGPEPILDGRARLVEYRCQVGYGDLPRPFVVAVCDYGSSTCQCAGENSVATRSVAFQLPRWSRMIPTPFPVSDVGFNRVVHIVDRVVVGIEHAPAIRTAGPARLEHGPFLDVILDTV